MTSLSLSLLFLLASSLLPVHAAALPREDGQPGGHLGKHWGVAVGVSLGLLLVGAAVTILIVTTRQRRRKLHQAKQPDHTYASHPPQTFSPSIPYGISRPSSVYQPRDKHGRKGSPDRSSPLQEPV